MRCPRCRSNNIRTYKSIDKESKTFKYNTCNKCNNNFKSIEYIPTNWDYERLYKGLVREIDAALHKYKEKYEGEW